MCIRDSLNPAANTAVLPNPHSGKAPDKHCPVPVSYTHLFSKRRSNRSDNNNCRTDTASNSGDANQGKISNVVTIVTIFPKYSFILPASFLIIFVCYAILSLSLNAPPVSYTHLDVYKRQHLLL